MAIIRDETSVTTKGVYPEEPYSGVFVWWQNQGQPLVNRWDVHNGFTDRSILWQLWAPDGNLIWSANVGPSTDTTYISAEVIPAYASSFNWRRTTKLNDFSFAFSG